MKTAEVEFTNEELRALLLMVSVAITDRGRQLQKQRRRSKPQFGVNLRRRKMPLYLPDHLGIAPRVGACPVLFGE
jgi:hypothetical protein